VGDFPIDRPANWPLFLSFQPPPTPLKGDSMEKVDLTKDLQALEYYQADALIDELIVLELHFLHIYEGRLVAFCISCLEKHLRAVRKLSGECEEGRCRPEKLWQDIDEWASNLLQNKEYLKLKKGSPLAQELSQQARDFRKKLEEIIAKYEMFGNKDDEKPLEP